MWRHKTQYLDTLVPVIANQIVYLLVTTDSDDEAHEERNLVRLYQLFSEIPDIKTRYNHYLCDVLDAIGRKLDGEKKGISMASSTLEMWQKTLNET